MKRYLAKTKLWIVLIPLLSMALGTMLNQLVLLANHDKFPVMLNDLKVATAVPLASGMLDSTHCIMTPQTHLNFLGDVFDLHALGFFSPGDFFWYSGTFLFPYVAIFWLGLTTAGDLRER